MKYDLLTSYFLRSEEKKTAWFLLLGCCLCIGGMTAIIPVWTSCSLIFMNALAAMDTALFLSSLINIIFLTLSYSVITVVKDFLKSHLSIRWRQWLTNNMLATYLKDQQYLRVSRDQHDRLDNPAQRIQTNISIMTAEVIDLTLELLQNILILIAFLGTLWVVGGSLIVTVAGLSFAIPGYLVWTAILFAVIANGLTHVIGRSLAYLLNEQNDNESNFRDDIKIVDQNAENIAQNRAEPYYKAALSQRLKDIFKKSLEILSVRVRLQAFKTFIGRIGFFMPYLLAAPLYLAKKMAFTQIMQIAFAFQQIELSLSWFSHAYERLSNLKTSFNRVSTMHDRLSRIPCTQNTVNRVQPIKPSLVQSLVIANLSLYEPSGQRDIFKNLNVTFESGQHTVICGVSGLGKSTLFKAIAGTWTYGSGDIYLPANASLFFLPQEPDIQHNTLRAVLAYPDQDATRYTDDEYKRVLEQVGLRQLQNSLDMNRPWYDSLSRGEQQKISFARALLRKPTWLFLDEATASLDEENEAMVYQLLVDALPDTTMISIAHRATVNVFHHHKLHLTMDQSTRSLRAERMSLQPNVMPEGVRSNPYDPAKNILSFGLVV